MQHNNVAPFAWTSLVLAAILLVTPWVLGFASGPALTLSLVCGLLIAASSILSLTASGRYEGWRAIALLNLVLGATVFIGPLLFHYNDNNPATWIHMIIGVVISVVATLHMWRLTALTPRVPMAA